MKHKEQIKPTNRIFLSKCGILLTCFACALLAFTFFSTRWMVQTVSFAGLPQDLKTYWVIDNLSAGDEQYYFSNEYQIENVISCIDKMENTKTFDYCIYGEQYVYCKDRKDPLLSYEVNEITSRLFTPNMADGKYFCEEDYHYDAGRLIPVVVGYELASEYPVGMVFAATFMCTEVQFCVKGILEKETAFPFRDEITFEDEHILIPAIHFKKEDITEQNVFLAKALYLQYLSGFVVATQEETFESLISEIDSYYGQMNISVPKFARVDAFSLYVIRIRKNVLLTAIITLTIFALRIVCIVHCEEKEKTGTIFTQIIKGCAICMLDYMIWIIICKWQITPSFTSVDAKVFFVIDLVLTAGGVLCSRIRRSQ